MIDNLTQKLAALITIGIIFTFIFYSFYIGNRFYNNIFRLSLSQISVSLSNINPRCKKISDCNLLPGDILIRRYITKRTWLVDKLAHPYFTHAAFYIGDDKIVEAVGKERDRKDDIQIGTLSKSNWMYPEINNFVIIRPKKYSQKLPLIKNNLINIANDPDYIFGFADKEYKRATCADLIFNQLLNEKIIFAPNVPMIITPDYLFWVTKNDSVNFDIRGHSFQE